MELSLNVYAFYLLHTFAMEKGLLSSLTYVNTRIMKN